jgi:poly-beta-hydroxybutyrate-responsive repressor
MPRHRSPPPDDSADATGRSPRDLLVPHVLLAISLRHAHGYAIEEYLHQLGLIGVETSTLYRTLRQLERDGLLRSDWEPGPAGPARRVYALTDLGTRWLDHWAVALSAYRTMIDRFFGLYTSGGSTARDT